MDKGLFKILGKRVCESRKSQKITQEELAEETGISPSFLGMIERGQSIPSIMTIKKICDALELSMDYLFETDATLIREKNAKYDAKGKENDPVINRITGLLKVQKPEDRKLALKILKKLFHK